jgi:hypothetical protein
MKTALIISISLLFAVSCMTPEKLLKNYGNSYTYSQISATTIGFCAPLVTSATVDLSEYAQFQKTNEFHDNEAGSIRSSFYSQLKRQIKMRSLPWNVLNDTLNTRIATLCISDSLRSVTIPPELKSSLQIAGIATLILIYNIQSVHDQKASLVQGSPTMGANGYMTGGISSMRGSIDIDFTYKCAVLDVQNEKVVMFVKMHESSDEPLNFYDQVCESLFKVLLIAND